MFISIKAGEKVSHFLSKTSIENALSKTKAWAKNFKPRPTNKTRLADAKAKNPDIVPFCHQYWADAQAEGILRPHRYRTVDSHGELNGFNHLFVTGQGSKSFQDTMGFSDNRIIRDVVRETDWQFKSLKPTEEAVTVFRCIGEKPEFFETESKLYQKLFNKKKGDIIYMPEYAYFAGATKYSDVYKGVGGRGVTIEMEIPAGARVSHSGDIVNGRLDSWGAECVIPRGSRAEVLESRVLEDGSCYKKVRYILPDEPWRN